MPLSFSACPGTKRIPVRAIATGSAGDYWIEDTDKLNVQDGRHGPVSLFQKKRVRFVYKDSFPTFAAAADAAEKLDMA